MAYPRYQLAKQFKVTTRSSGDLTLNSTNWANVDTGLDITLAAQVGDTLEATLSARAAADAVHLYLDVVTLVSAAPVNSFGKRGAVQTTPGIIGIAGWYCTSGTSGVPGGPAHYVVVSGDLTSGLVTLRLRYATNTATNKTIFADGTSHIIEFCVKNLGPVDSS